MTRRGREAAAGPAEPGAACASGDGRHQTLARLCAGPEGGSAQ